MGPNKESDINLTQYSGSDAQLLVMPQTIEKPVQSDPRSGPGKMLFTRGEEGDKVGKDATPAAEEPAKPNKELFVESKKVTSFANLHFLSKDNQKKSRLIASNIGVTQPESMLTKKQSKFKIINHGSSRKIKLKTSADEKKKDISPPPLPIATSTQNPTTSTTTTGLNNDDDMSQLSAMIDSTINSSQQQDITLSDILEAEERRTSNDSSHNLTSVPLYNAASSSAVFDNSSLQLPDQSTTTYTRTRNSDSISSLSDLFI